MSTQPQTPRLVPLANIRVEPAAQVRQKVHTAVVKSYAQAMKQQMEEQAWRFPPVVLFDDGKSLWLGDGRQRCAAAEQAGLTQILGEIRQGSERDALLFAISSNSEHGLPRTNAEKKIAVMHLFKDAEWKTWSDREIARRCQVAQSFVSRLRKLLSDLGDQIASRKVQRGDTVYEMRPRTTNDTATSQEPAAPVENGPSLPARDGLGIALPERTATVFVAVDDFDAARNIREQLAGLIDRIAHSPSGEALRPHLVARHKDGKQVFHAPELEAFGRKLLSAAPFCGHCPQCLASPAVHLNRGCKLCGGLGWLTRGGFDACPESLRAQLYALRDKKT
jgi:hypothetical protein